MAQLNVYLSSGLEIRPMPDRALFLTERYTQVSSYCWTVYARKSEDQLNPAPPGFHPAYNESAALRATFNEPSRDAPRPNRNVSECQWNPYHVGYKNYWRTTEVNASCSFAFRTAQEGMNVYVYSLKAVYLNDSLGECWIDNDDIDLERPRTQVTTHLPPERVDEAHVIEFNVGVHTLVGTATKAGPHTLTCRMIRGVDFRIMGILVD